ncbi:hypothetical protein RQP46_010161 [Phenoliferia psychrophenolica]
MQPRALWACALTCLALHEVSNAELYRTIVHGRTEGLKERNAVVQKFLASRRARIAVGKAAHRTENLTFTFRGQVTIWDNLYTLIEKAEDLKSLTVSMAAMETDDHKYSEEDLKYEGFRVGWFFYVCADSFKNLVIICFIPGERCHQLDLPAVIEDALPSLKEVHIGDVSRHPSEGLPNLLRTLLWGFDDPARTLDLSVVFSKKHHDCQMVAVLTEIDFLPALTRFAFSRSAPLPLINLIAHAPHLEHLTFKDHVHYDDLWSILGNRMPALKTLVLSPLGHNQCFPASQAEETFAWIATALINHTSDGNLLALEEIRFSAAYLKDGEHLKIEDGPRIEQLETVCEEEGVKLFARLP